MDRAPRDDAQAQQASQAPPTCPLLTVALPGLCAALTTLPPWPPPTLPPSPFRPFPPLPSSLPGQPHTPSFLPIVCCLWPTHCVQTPGRGGPNRATTRSPGGTRLGPPLSQRGCPSQQGYSEPCPLSPRPSPSTAGALALTLAKHSPRQPDSFALSRAAPKPLLKQWPLPGMPSCPCP